MSEHGLRALIALIAGIALIIAGLMVGPNGQGIPGSMIASIIDTSALNKTG